MVDVPAVTPVTKPVADMVATEVLEEVQAFEVAAVPEPVNCVVEPAHTLSVPLIVGRGFTVIVVVAEQPLKAYEIV
jgi:hypothetical protein